MKRGNVNKENKNTGASLVYVMVIWKKVFNSERKSECEKNYG